LGSRNAMGDGRMKAIEMDGVSFSYHSRPETPVLNDLVLSVKKGEFVGVVGCTGAGKSTLLYCMNGIIPSLIPGRLGGSIRVNGEDIRGKQPSHFAGKVGLLFQDPDSQLFAPTVREEVGFGLGNIGVPEKEGRERIRESLRFVGLDGLEAADPRELSFGQRQKVALASVLAMEPDILLLDEPVSALDWKSANDIYEVLESMNLEGKTIIAVEHNTELLAEYAERVLLLKNGKIAMDADPEEAFSNDFAEDAGLKVPCSVKIGKSLGIRGAVTPARLAELLRRRK